MFVSRGDCFGDVDKSSDDSMKLVVIYSSSLFFYTLTFHSVLNFNDELRTKRYACDRYAMFLHSVSFRSAALTNVVTDHVFVLLLVL